MHVTPVASHTCTACNQINNVKTNYKIMRYVLIIFLVFPFITNAQSASFQNIYLTEKISNGVDTVITYPVIILKNKVAANKINETIKRRLFWDEGDNLKSTTFLLSRDKSERDLSVSYEIEFNRNGFLSIELFEEAVAAYPTSWTEYFNFDLNTGKELALGQLILPEKYEEFKQEVFRRKKDSLLLYLKETKQRLESGDISQDIYEEDTAMISQNGCLDSVSLSFLHISDSFIQVHDDCFFPHAMIAEEPYYELIFDFIFLKEFIKPEIFKKLTSK